MVRTPNPSKERLSTKKSTSSEISQVSEDDDKTRKHGKRGQLKDQADEDVDKEDVKINGESDKAASGTHTESTVEISYEDYLTENCDELVEPDITETKAVDESQNAGRDIRSFFSKGPATFKLQNPSFSTIKVKAEIHEPCSKLSGEALTKKSPVLLAGIFAKQKERHQKCIKGCIEITDDDLVIEYLDDETFKSEEAGGLLKVSAGIKSAEAGGLLKAPSGIKSDETGGLLKAPSGIKSVEAGGLLNVHTGIKSGQEGGLLKATAGIKSDEMSGLLKVPPGINSTLKNNDTNKFEPETVIDKLQIKENAIPVEIIDECRGGNSAKPETVMESMLNGSVTKRQNMNDVLMGKHRQVQDSDSQKQKPNSDGASGNSKDKKAETKKRGRGRGSKVNNGTVKECNGVDVGEKSVSQDDEETCPYMPPVSTSVSASVLVKPIR